MRTYLFNLTCFLVFVSHAQGFGLAVLDAEAPLMMPPRDAAYSIAIEEQVALTTLSCSFRNPYNHAVAPVWAFPLHNDASPTALRFRMNGEWFEASIQADPDGSGLPGDGVHPLLAEYLGDTPLLFDFVQELPPDSSLLVELDFVELLPYSFGEVCSFSKGDMGGVIPNLALPVRYSLQLNSAREVLSIELLEGLDGAVVELGETGAGVEWSDPFLEPQEDFRLSYVLDQDELGLFASSVWLPDSLMPEDGAPGFLVFVAEPDPDDHVNVMQKVFTLVIDRSGSMNGNKIVQARSAADFVVNNLNEGDRFNLVDFATSVNSFRPEHVPFTPENQANALSYISQIYSGGSTNISGAFDLAVPQFDAANDSTANIILFFTDGQPTTGITETNALVSHITNLIAQEEALINLFSFGIGPYANQQLLGLMSNENNGFAQFLGDDELEERITEFYLQVRNPVLINPQLSISPPVVQDLVPLPLPNLYGGMQMIVCGRYSSSEDLEITMSGVAFGQGIEYSYPLSLSDSYDPGNAYIPKVWAKRKIESLLIQYYLLDPDSAEAEALEEEIIELSVTWGILSPFTSFNDDTYVDEHEAIQGPQSLLLVENYPNPFNPSTVFRIQLPAGKAAPLSLRIYNLRGELVRTIMRAGQGGTVQKIVWDGLDDDARLVASGTYIVVVEFLEHLTAHKVSLIR